jgi:uncharacterized protein (DUF305 family)
MTRIFLTVSAIAIGAAAALAQSTDHSQHDMSGMTGDTFLTKEWAEINDSMHAAMMVELTGDPDVDFIRGMIPHHEGAVAMAELVLQNSHNHEVKHLAKEIIAAQQAEIAWMKKWLQDNPPAAMK